MSERLTSRTRRNVLKMTGGLLAAGSVGVGTASAAETHGATIALSGGIVPETEVTVTATYDGSAFANAEVEVEGGGSGVTDESGQATVMMPSAAALEMMNLSVDLEADEPDRSAGLEIGGDVLDAVLGTASVASGINIEGDFREDDAVTLQADAAGAPMADADVEVDSDEVAETNESGYAGDVDVVDDDRFRVEVEADDREVGYGQRWD